MANESEIDDQIFDEAEMDKVIRQILDRVRGNYFENGAGANGIPAEVKRIIEAYLGRQR